MRIYELAKKLGVKNKLILCELSKLGIEGKTHSSNIESELAKTIENIILKGGIEQPKEGVLDRWAVNILEERMEHPEPIEKEDPGILFEEEKSKALLIPKMERLQVLRRLRKERWREYLKHDMIDLHIEHEKPSEERKAGILPERDKTEAPLQIEDEELKADISEEKEKGAENLPVNPVGIAHGISSPVCKNGKSLNVSSSWQTMAHSYGVKQKNVEEHRSIITGLVISAIFIITVLFFTVVNYYVWRDKTHERPETKALDLPVQKEGSTGQVDSGLSTPPQDNEVVSQPLFTIQAGAFSDAYYAKSLKTRLNKKGYHAFITISSSNEGRLYKVLVGKFSNRRKAEMLSAKIKRVEGLQTFVTLWKKQYLKNSKASSLRVSVHKCLATQETQALYFSYYVS